MNPYSVVLRPIISEKSNDQRAHAHKYFFWVDLAASKPEIKGAIEKLFDVRVNGVQTIIMRGHRRRRGQYAFQAPKRKKAMVTLHAGQTIKIFDEQ